MKIEKKTKNYKRLERNLKLGITAIVLGTLAFNVHATGDDPMSVVNNLSTFIFGLIRAIGMIILGFGVVQFGLSLKSHDPAQRANSFLTIAGGIVITFSKEILDMITK